MNPAFLDSRFVSPTKDPERAASAAAQGAEASPRADRSPGAAPDHGGGEGAGPRGEAAAARRRVCVAGLAFLRGADADGRIRLLVAERRGVRLLLGTLAGELIARSRFEPLGFRTLGDFARERLGVSATSLREWARVARALCELPRCCEAVESGAVSWSVARRAVAFATPETDEAFAQALHGRTVHAAAAMLRAAFGSAAQAGTGEQEKAEATDAQENQTRGCGCQGAPSGAPGEVSPHAGAPTDPASDGEEDDDRVRLRVPLARAHHGRWLAALELARRSAGASLPVWECAELIAAEALSAIPPHQVADAARALGLPGGEAGRAGTGEGAGAQRAEPHAPAGCAGSGRRPSCVAGVIVKPAVTAARADADRPSCVAGGPRAGDGRSIAGGTGPEHGLRHVAFPALRWSAPEARRRAPRLDLRAIQRWAQAASPHGLDRALRKALARLQGLDHDLGHVLRQVADRRLYRELGFPSFERYAAERVDVSPRTARRWVWLARLAPPASAVAEALRTARLTPKQAALVAAAASPFEQQALVEHAQQVTLRRLEDDLAAAELLRPRTHVTFSAPREAANVFLLALEAAARHLAACPGGGGEGRKARAPGPPAATTAPEAALGWILDHAISTWTHEGEQFRDSADFTRDGFRCTAPGCTQRRNLQSHHVVFRSAGGPDVPWNRTTLCAFHHLRGIHAGVVSCRGKAPGELVFALGLRPAGPPLLVAASGDVLMSG